MAHNFETSTDAIRWAHDTAKTCLDLCQDLYKYWTDKEWEKVYYIIGWNKYNIPPLTGDEWGKASSIICNDYLHGDTEARSILRFKVAEYKYAITGDEYSEQYQEISKRVWELEPPPFYVWDDYYIEEFPDEENKENEKIAYNNAKWLIAATQQLRLFYSEISTFMRDPDDLQTDYKTMPRTHRIAAVWGLFDKLGLSRTKDRTKLAAFVEAVTGGNIEARPKDTVSYKRPTKDAKEAVSEWLKKIGVE